MTRDMLEKVGEALYGPRWQSELARDLDVADRTLRRWVAGTSPIPDGVAADAHKLVMARVNALNALAQRLSKAAAKPRE